MRYEIITILFIWSAQKDIMIITNFFCLGAPVNVFGGGTDGDDDDDGCVGGLIDCCVGVSDCFVGGSEH